jgi:hypothetical protein
MTCSTTRGIWMRDEDERRWSPAILVENKKNKTINEMELNAKIEK